MSVRTGLDLATERVFLELGSNNGVKNTVALTSNTARALAGQLIANADALDHSLEQGYLGNDETDA